MVCLNWQGEESRERQGREGKREVMTGRSRDEVENKGARDGGAGEKDVRETRNREQMTREGE